MNVAERLHEAYGHDRRVRVLTRHFCALLPQGARLLDVGCGDGLLAHRISEQRPDVEVRGIDVLVRPSTHVPVEAFDGLRIPHPDDAFDCVSFVDVLHHSDDAEGLLREAKRVSSRAILVKDHTLEGWLAGPTLRFMDRVGNARHGVSIPHNYWTRAEWNEAVANLGLHVEVWDAKVGLYPWPASWLFDRSLHFVARLGVAAPGRVP